MLLMLELLRRRLGGVDGKAIALSLLRITAASLVLAVVAYYVSRLLGQILHVPITEFRTIAPAVGTVAAAAHPISVAKVALQVLASLAAGGVSYIAALHLLGAPELTSLRDVVRRRRGAGEAA
jgi:hypothetical protein